MNYDLEERLINFAVLILDIAESMPLNYGAAHLSKQIARSGTAPALNYGEAHASESRADFIHKMKVALKELRESFVCLKIIEIKRENNELISIFVKSIKTAQQNSILKKK